MIRNFAFSAVALLGSCGAVDQCAPVPPGPAPTEEVAVASENSDCNNTISWHGRSPVHVPKSRDDREITRLIDSGNAVNLGLPGQAHVAGHYSSKGAIFRSGPTLSVGDSIEYDCQQYTVTGRGSASAGTPWRGRDGLTVQYSGCGSVCLVFAQ